MSTQTSQIPELDLLGWKRAVFDLYAQVRAAASPEAAWRRWREARDRLVGSHPCSPLTAARRETFRALRYHPYDAASRVLAATVPADGADVAIATSTGDRYLFSRIAYAVFEHQGSEHRLALYWLQGYGGGVFLPFADTTNGASTYGSGRYLLDTVKGADLGHEAGRLVLDFNFAYNPSCSYDPHWTCPLPPAENRLAVPVEAGELAFAGDIVRTSDQ